MIARRWTLAAAVSLGIAAGYAAWPQNKPASKTGGEAKKPRIVTVEVDEVIHNDASGIGEGKKIVIRDGETVITADHGKWNQKKETAEGTGNLTMTDPQADAIGDKAFIQFGSDKRIVDITGGVKITVKPKKKAGASGDKGEEDSPRSHPAVITCDRAQYHYAAAKKYGLLTGNFRVVQQLKEKTRTVTAEKAEWFGREERVLLYPPVHFEDTEGYKGDTQGQVTIYTTEGDERLLAKEKVILSFPVKEEEEEPATPAKRP